MGSLWSWWMLWAGATLLWGLTQEASVGPRTTEGEEFLTAFLQNYQPWYSSASLHLLISSLSDSPASVSILSRRDNTSQKVTVKPGQSVLVSISSKAEMTGSNIFQRAVVVHSDHNISVQAVNKKPGTAEVTVLRPVRTLGTTYFVLTPSGASMTNLKEFAVVAGAAGALVSIQLKGVVTFQGKVYPPGSVLSMTLEPFAVAQLQSTHDLSGSKVTASSPVAVLSGHSCVQKYTNCDHVVEQLLPTSSWGTRYVVPPLSSQAHYDLVYVVASQATKLTYNHGGTTGSRGLQSGDVVEFEVWSSHPLYLSADVGIQVLLFGTGGMRDMVTYDPYLTVIPDVAAYCPAYVIGTLSDLQNLAVVVAPTKAAEGLTVDGRVLGTQATWTAVPGSEFSYAEVDFGTAAKTHTAEAAADFGLLTFGLAETVGYATVPACGRTLLDQEPSCEGVKCEPGQHCQVVDGKAKCVKEPTATCRAQGDPHYTTFDGRRYDMMGTCTYTLAELCGTDERLPAFSVEAKNENRGNHRVSYVGFVTVRAYSHAVSLARGEVGFARIDNQRSCLPVSLSDGRLRVYQSGMRAVVELDFGLVVSYNWDSQLTLSLPMRFRGQVCGLCGNYNGDPSDDFLTPDRVQVTDAMEFGKSWKLDDGDYLCQHGCQSNCPTCTQGQAQQYKGDHLCGMLTLSDGPFASCHASLDPQPFLEECVYDLCVVGGDRPSLCRGLLDYAQACLELGISVGDWRSPANCPVPCPANSRFELCGPACQATCNGAAAPANCSARPCVEGCVCLSGFVASGDACVPASDCGCTFEGRQLAPGQAVWADDQCRRRCTCDGATQQVRCSDTQGCPAGERCRVQDGLLGCYPDRFGTCEGSGDPHYVSFDGRRFDFMGTCTYLLAGLCGQNATLPDFRVLVENEHRGSQTVSYTRAVRVEARGVELAVRREYPGKVLLDGVLRCLPFQAADGQIQVFRQGSDAVIRTDFGLTVAFNWNSRVRAKVPGSYAEALCGLCGNFNGNPGDDLALRGGGQAANALAFGNSWLEETRPGCGPVDPGECPNLDSLVTQQVQSKKECGILADPEGPFRECHNTLDPQGAVRDCVYDRCLLPGQSGPLCEALAAYAAACQAAGATVDSWRSETFCPLQCPAHSHYEAHSHGCPLSCGDIPVPGGCGSDFFESCVCDEGFVLSGESCVPLASCGCVHQGIYHPPGQTFHPGPGCESLCHCQEGGLVSCEPSSCGPHEACKPSAGILGCVPVGSATCQASGDPHYTTFDGRRFDFMGTCVYVLAQTCGAQAGLEQFTVLQENAAWGNGKVSVTRVVTVQVANFTLRLEQNRWNVKVDGVDLKLPVELAQGRVRAFKHGSDAVIETDFGLRVAYDLKYYARVTIPGNYHGQLCGLCGNYNGDPKDDFLKPNGSQAGNSNEFGDSWEKPVPDSPCGPVCPAGDECELPKCAPELEEKYQQEKSCGLLASTTGPLAACHKLVDPQGPLQECVFDLCLGGGNDSILCSNIHAYVSACQAAGGQIKPWRNETFCPMPCPPHSHYEICADTCSLGCSALSAPSPCPDRCAEGCQCDSGFLSDGQGCVPIQDCGCYDSGIYFDLNKTVLIDNCQKQCVCHAGEGLVCQNHSCEAQQVCQPVAGVLSCINKGSSCEDVKCEPGQHCQVVDGKAKCVKEPTATCRAQGDPHYTTFDGRRYDMMGTCTYMLAELCGTDERLPAFSVEAKNENRGNHRVSYVGFVTVHAYSHAVSLARGEVGFARIDNQRSCLPVSLSDGRLRVYQSGMRAVVELDFGLVVSYNWDSQLTLSLPMRFRGQVCGLCGNYNGDPSDDFLTPDRVQVTDAMEFGKSWKLDDGDYLCQHGCQSNCPTCTQGQAQQYKGDHLCGMLTLSDGPFASCHASLDPQPFLEECVYDLCVVGGDRPSLCRGLLDYAQACLELGISVGDWRSPANCPVPCPANSRFELCGPACQATCNGAAAPANCSARPCVEGCVCLSGFVASGDACVPASDCGCTFEGRQLAPGQAVWADDQCRRRCTCDGATQEVRCSDTQGCPAGERCRVQDGLLGCYPDRFGTCEGSGDPHYVSFDGRRFDFMGTCTYLLAGLCGQNATLPDFRVLVENEHRGSQTVSYTRAVRVEARGVELAVRREYPGKVLLDGVLRCLPFQAADGQIQVFRQGSDAVIRTDFGLTVAFNWNSRVRAKVPGSYAEALCGLCGNFNGNPGDDLALRGGGQAANALAFGNSWLEETRPGCGPVDPGECPNLDSLVTQQVQSKKECGILADPEGPFRECHNTLDPQGAVRDCVYDRCLLPGQSGPLCEALAAYAAACQAAGATVDSWRSETFCPLQCPAHSHYEAHSHGCPLSCGDIPVPGGCGSDFFESCVCDEGFVLSGESCVPLASCGCVHQGIYHPPGQTFHPGPGCESLCHCQEGGLVSCEPSSCGPHEACKPSAGILGCVPVGSATCQASGDPHYTTFDGRRFDFMGTCVYVLAQTCGAQAGLEQFTVLQENAAWGNGKVSVTRVVTVQVANFTLRLEQNRWNVKVDGVDLKLPVELAQGRVRAFKHGSDAVIETDFGLRVAYDLKYYARVTIPGNYHGQLCGLCGNYNGDPKDDFLKPNGSQAGNSNEFGDSWEKPVPDSPCGPVCPAGDECELPKCAPELEEKYQQEKSCGLLASTTGPLAACHKLVDPQGPLQECVFDLCLGGGNDSILCSNIHAYVSACQAAGGQIKPWRNETFCPMPCPPYSHYEICADTCSLGCSALSAPSPCPDRCAEGCQCDSGFLSDGQGCVPIQDCGCYDSGIYFDLNKTVLIDNCQKQCVCHAGEGLVCQNHSCEAQQVCQPVAGVLSCINKDPCHGVTCRPQETCREQGGQGVCVPNYEVTCWLWGDPHYHSFDGRDFDFQGTCNYVLATTVCPGVNAEGLTPFTISTKNENRGNPAVSYVRLVTVTALGTNISIHKGEIGKVRVNDVLTALPALVAGGRLAVAHSASKAVLTADFGLRVAYDWNWRVEVTLPSSYHSTVCGLCGNMDGNSSNDHMFPNGTLAPSTAIWGGSWRAPGWDPLCWDECKGACPTCPENRLEEYGGPGFCGLLVPGTRGPFTACHAHVPPDSFFKGCVLDVCLGGGAKDILCQALAAYAASCQAARITIEDWREQAGCVIPCPDNSHYELCGPPCPASCPSPVPSTTPDPCSGPCIEGCQCDKGYVLSVDRCVPLDGGCGCWANGTYHEAGSEFWADGSCSRRCRCGPGGGSLICTPASCGQGEECVLLPSGQHGCHPISTAECQAWGDPHYITLDGKRFDFQGACEYLLSAPCQALPAGAENFTVTVANEHRGSQAVSYTRSVTLHIYNHSLTLSTQWPQRLQVDGKLVALPFQLDSPLRAYLSGADVVVTAANGLSLSFNRDGFVRLQVPAAYAGALCGLCGNYNRDPADDLKNDPARWQVGGAADCGECVPGPCPPPCTPEQQAPFGGPDACGVISATDGPLASCHSLLPPEPYFQACLLDACQAQGHLGGLCPAVATYVAACQAAGAQLDEWRRPDFCPFQCPANSHYKLCGNSCPVSCPSLSAPEGCEPACREGCVCDAGFVLSGDTCVPVGQCGCLHEGHYYSLGEAFYPGPECERRCECGPGGQVRCQAGSACRPHEECRLENGVQACHPTGCGHCLSSGGIHYVTLDGRVYDLHGSCSYVLAQVCDPQLEDEDFSIVLEKDAAGVFQRLLVTVDNLVVSLAPRLQVSVDGETVTLPVAVGPVRVTAEGRNVVLQTAKGLRLLFDDNAYILMSIPSPFRSRLCGLCGNFNGNWSDDFVLPSGNTAPSVEAFGAAWRAPSSSVGCSEGCRASGCPVCSAEQTAPYESTEACGRLQDPQGPFQACHAALRPSEYFRQCVYDMCIHKGDSAVLCRSLAAYTAACQAAGMAVKPWRTDSFCPLQCPAHSHYSICTRSCQGSCAALSGLTGCTTRCFEGCECDDHFLLSNGACIPIQDCGCTHDGRYLPVNSSLLTSDCSQRCSCSSSTGLTCQAAGCPEGRVCEVQAGTRDCWATRGLCSLSADGNLTSFDGAHLAVNSPGVYELSSLCPGRPETRPWYRVVTDVQPCAGKAEGLGQAHIFFRDGLVTVTPSQGVWVNGRRVDLPAEVLTCVFVSQTPDGSVRVQQKAGVQVLLGTNGQLTILVSNDHSGMLCGACGNFDGDRTNDGHDSQGKPALESWRAPDFSPCHS
ncbi:IgGFc-binding protein [Dugong dugon]